MEGWLDCIYRDQLRNLPKSQTRPTFPSLSSIFSFPPFISLLCSLPSRIVPVTRLSAEPGLSPLCLTANVGLHLHPLILFAFHPAARLDPTNHPSFCPAPALRRPLAFSIRTCGLALSDSSSIEFLFFVCLCLTTRLSIDFPNCAVGTFCPLLALPDARSTASPRGCLPDHSIPPSHNLLPFSLLPSLPFYFYFPSSL